MDQKDIQIESKTNSTPLVDMKITHIPTGISVSGRGYGKYKLKEQLMKKLASKVNLDEKT